ncbi:MAG: DNA-binding NarL/FixJ family response regulator [Bacteroidia bacterium]|jgi:DNA-binding NarL/FixJ family response regulator
MFNFNTMNNQHQSIISNRECQVLQMVAVGKRSLDIASQFELSVYTINNHRKNMLRKTGCSNTTQLIIWGMKNGLIK